MKRMRRQKGLKGGAGALENSLDNSYINMHLRWYNHALPFLNINLGEIKIYAHAKICTQMFIVALSISVINCKEPNG